MLLYYSMLPRVLVANAFRCQENHIDILKGKSQSMDFVVLS